MTRLRIESPFSTAETHGINTRFEFGWPNCSSQNTGAACSHRDHDTCKYFHYHAQDCPWITGDYEQLDETSREEIKRPATKLEAWLVQAFDVHGDRLYENDAIEFYSDEAGNLTNLKRLLEHDNEVDSVRVFREVEIDIVSKRVVELVIRG